MNADKVMEEALVEHKFNAETFIAGHIIRADVSDRGGQVVVDVSDLFPEIPKDRAQIGAFQNYLGGGIAGSIQAGAKFHSSELSIDNRQKLRELETAVKSYFFELNNGGGDEYMQSLDRDFEDNQRMPVSGY